MAIYFIKPVNAAGPIKIGCSCGVKWRIRQLESDTRLKYEVLAEAPGDFWAERNLHRKFASFRTDAPFDLARPYTVGGVTEWFEPAAELLAYIAMVRATGTLGLADDERVEIVIAARHDSGDTYEQIANDLGFSKQRAHQIHREHLSRLARKAAA